MRRFGRFSPLQIILVGFVLVLSGFVLPFLMVIQIIPASFVLSFLSHAASVSGLFLGIIGAAMYVGSKQRR
jgi:hypothetical protein